MPRVEGEGGRSNGATTTTWRANPECGNGMGSAGARSASVGDLYSGDEVELLLDEIRDLEAGRRAEVQDFEIAGSVTGPPPGSPAPSWDSHARYRRRPGGGHGPVGGGSSGCAAGVRAALLAAAGAAGGCVWALVGRRAWLLPLAGRARLLQLAALTTLLPHGALLAARLARAPPLLPWARLGAVAAAWSGAALAAAGALLLHAVLAAPEYRAAPPRVSRPLLAAAGLALAAAPLAALLAWLEVRAPPAPRRPGGPYRAVPGPGEVS